MATTAATKGRCDLELRGGHTFPLATTSTPGSTMFVGTPATAARVCNFGQKVRDNFFKDGVGRLIPCSGFWFRHLFDYVLTIHFSLLWSRHCCSVTLAHLPGCATFLSPSRCCASDREPGHNFTIHRSMFLSSSAQK